MTNTLLLLFTHRKHRFCQSPPQLCTPPPPRGPGVIWDIIRCLHSYILSQKLLTRFYTWPGIIHTPGSRPRRSLPFLCFETICRRFQRQNVTAATAPRVRKLNTTQIVTSPGVPSCTELSPFPFPRQCSFKTISTVWSTSFFFSGELVMHWCKFCWSLFPLTHTLYNLLVFHSDWSYSNLLRFCDDVSKQSCSY